MFTKAVALFTTIAVAASSVFAADPLVLNTPANARQCIPTLITWSGGNGLFFLTPYMEFAEPNTSFLTAVSNICLVLSGIERTPIQEFGGLPADQHSFLWQTNVASGSLVSLDLADDVGGELVQSGFFVIGDGPNNCTLVQDP
ncbi:hypothetical protein C8Q79DRAFT_1004427 [Trametes meyenii]|nr:hypothetical protein C8Q79DRAFT_1004427 [Trametes meyenii]